MESSLPCDGRNVSHIRPVVPEIVARLPEEDHLKSIAWMIKKIKLTVNVRHSTKTLRDPLSLNDLVAQQKRRICSRRRRRGRRR